MTGVAVVGIGAWGRNLVRTFDAVADVPVCCHTGDPERAAWLAEQFPDVDVTTDYEAVLADDRVDAVAVATPIPTLEEIAGAALEADRHVYVEKPMADSREGAERLAAMAADRGRTLFVGYVFVHHPAFARARERVATEGLRHLRLDWHTGTSLRWSVVHNLVCHPVSVAVAALGDPDAVDVTGAWSVTGGADVVDCSLRYGDHACDVRVDRLAPEKRYALAAVTAAGNAYAATDDALYAFDPDAGASEVVYRPGVEPLERECRAFVEAVETGRSPVTDGWFGVRVHEVLERVAAGVDAETGG